MAVTQTELTGRKAQRLSRDLFRRIVKVDLSTETYVAGGLVVAHKMKTLYNVNITGPGSHLFTYDFATSKLMIYTAVGTQATGSLTIAGIRLSFEGTN